MQRIHSAIAALALLMLSGGLAAQPQTVDVRAQVELVHPGPHKSAAAARAHDVVVWLASTATDPPAVTPGHFRMAQKDKNFHPHMLVIPLGSTVAFPNLDPFFHNVFSQFNGKRFDLGLYEAGSTRDVRFDHEGVSYIFCNIHPEMSAVIITLATPWYAVASLSGAVTLHDVAPGSYELHVWTEDADARQLQALGRRVRVSADQDDLGVIRVVTRETTPVHKNIFGDDYRPEPSTPY
jgi:plastocyanin